MNKYDVLKKYFGYSSFRFSQEDIVDSILEYKNTIAIMQTGGGKSICFQIPSLMFSGITLVISPLISLMYDQVYELKGRNIKAEYLNSSLNKEEKSEILNKLKKGEVKILYLSPEALVNKEYLEILNKINISLFVVDEAHTIMWHMDFRGSFENIGIFLKGLNYKPVVALFSATANIYTINEMKKVLGLFNFNIITSSFDRKELYYRILKNVDKDKYIINYINMHKDTCGIIYASTKKDVERIYNTLKDKYSVTYYHAGLEASVKEENQMKFIKGSVDIIVATIAFGMGINKPNIRYVINYNIPDSLESLSQMMGRCSRDKEYGECIILYNTLDIKVLDYFIRSIDTTYKSIKEIKRVKKLKYIQKNTILKLCNDNLCIHKYMASYFGENIKKCGNMCNRCKKDKII